jgi:Flp pilus assembly protein TadD
MMQFRNRKTKELAAITARSRLLLTSGQHSKNFELLKKAIDQFPEDAEIRLLYATILLEFRPDEVAAEAAKAVELGSDNPSILVRGGSLLLSRGDRTAAEHCVERASKLAPTDFALAAGLENLKGLLAAFAGQDDLAERKLRGAVEKDPCNAPFASNLAVFLAERGRLEDGVEVLDEALPHVDVKSDLERMRARMAAEIASS